METGKIWLSIPEAAQKLGVTPTAIRNRIKRGTLERRLGNTGRQLVEIPAGTDDQNRNPLQGVTVTQTVTKCSETVSKPVTNSDDRFVVHLERQISELNERYEAQLAAERTRAEHALIAERARHAAETERLIAQFATERSFWTERADAAERRTERAEAIALDALTQAADTTERITNAMIEAAARPIWRRFFG